MAKEEFKIGGVADDRVGKRQYSNYYSGTDIRIYFGDMWIDEIVELQYGMAEQVAPIYGYASHTFDKVARGNRLVQGSFAINFKEAGYLQTVINSLSSKQKDGKWFDGEKFFNYEDKDKKTVGGNYKKSVEQIIENFDELAEDYENALWGYDSESTALLNSRKDGPFFYTSTPELDNQKMRDYGFNILITFGRGPYSERRSKGYQTSQTIVGVQLTGLQTRIDPSGNPVQEIYSFIAKDISGNLYKSS